MNPALSQASCPKTEGQAVILITMGAQKFLIFLNDMGVGITVMSQP